MSKKINRREFLVRGVGSLAGLTLAGAFTGTALAANGTFAALHGPEEPRNPCGCSPDWTVDSVPLGATGLTVSRMALGTGTSGFNNASNQTRGGQDNLNRIVRLGYERGVRFIDMAEGYGSMPFIGRATEELPRGELTLLSKMWTHPDGSRDAVPVRPKIEEYLRWLGTDYIDILLLHCMSSADWAMTRTHYMEGFSRAREAGLVRRMGVSCHDLGALRTAASHPWVDVILARINPFGSKMDGTVAEVEEVLRVARENGKGIVGMKIFGEGSHVTEPEREQSLRYAIRRSPVHAVTLGLETVAQMDDATRRVTRIVSEL